MADAGRRRNINNDRRQGRMSGAPVDLLDVRFRRDVEAIRRLPPRVLYEFLAELSARHLIRTEVEALARRYARLDPAVLAALGIEWWWQ